MKSKHLVALVAVVCTVAMLSLRSTVDEVAVMPPRTAAIAPMRPATRRGTQQPAIDDVTSSAPPPRDASAGAVADSDTVCRALEPHPNVSTSVSAQLCLAADGCSGSLTVTIEDCERSRRPLSANKSLSSVLDALGPDLLRLRLDGPEVTAVYGVYSGGCTYDFAVGPFFSAGEFTIGLERLYADYNAQDELTNQWPPLLKQPLLRVSSVLPPTNYHLQQVTLPSTERFSCAYPDTRPTRPVVPQLRHCTGLEQSTRGRWVRENPPSPVFTRVRVKKIQRNPIVFKWALASEPAAYWRPHHCLSRRDVSAAALPFRSIVIGGDSQARALYFGLVNHLSGFGDQCVRNITRLDSEPPECTANVKGSQRKRIGNVQLDFVDDLFLDKFHSSDRYAAYDVAIVGFAQHPASKEHWTLDKYQRSLSSRHRKAVALRDQGKLVVWYLAPQYPYTQVGYPVVVRDWRTDRRLQMFNAAAETLMRESGIPVLDGFAISSPMSHSSPDQAHFSNFVSTELIHMLLTILTASK